jgi:glutathione S-transferase
MAERPTLYIANKNYSSWSMRPWLAMRVAGIDFEEVLVPFDEQAGNVAFRSFSPTGKVPVLRHGSVLVWESLAILDYLADLHPDKALWPERLPERAVARSICAEMHAGFSGLRSECPMNMRRPRRAIAISEKARRDVQRIETIWRDALRSSGGPFLFGAFTNADAMFAPVVNRLDVYDLTDDPDVRAYMDRIASLPAWREWAEAGRAEPWIVEEDEA